jgi:hypothetical protein
MENTEKLIELAQALPDDLKENALRLIEEMSTPVEGIGDNPTPWKPGFLRLVQGTTDRSSLPKGTAIGDFVLGERKLEQPLKFIPFRIWDTRQYWDPDQTNNKMLCWSPDAKLGQIGRDCYGCPHAKWVENVGSDCGKSKSVLAISSDFTSVFLIQFSKSNFKIGNELESAMKKAGVSPYLRIYGLSSATSSTAKNVENFKIQILDEKDRKTPEALVPFLKEMFNAVSDDRKKMIEIFYKNAAEKREQLALSNKTGDEKPLELETTVSVEEVKSSEVSGLAKNYSL